MKNLSCLSVILWFLASTVTLHSQFSEKATILSGKILFEPDSIHPLKPYSIIVEKSWPITYSEFEQVRIDTTDYSFSIRMDPEGQTYGISNPISRAKKNEIIALIRQYISI